MHWLVVAVAITPSSSSPLSLSLSPPSQLLYEQTLAGAIQGADERVAEARNLRNKRKVNKAARFTQAVWRNKKVVTNGSR